ncbi:MAG: hypothetical protein C4519_18270 [Desulfobacteraceae bacterium]|nr:MAG: hypothetical protein C4519_18270 [Desulfobacteraceae bacterium]
MRRRWFGFLCLGLLIGLNACGQGISKQIRSQVTFSGPFRQLQEGPERYVGEMAILGGKIIEVRPLDNGTELMVLQLELDGSDRPQDNDQSQGRFLVHSDQFLDPAIYAAGTLITAVGRVKGSEQRYIGQMAYRYPTLAMEEIKKWPQTTESYPRFHFGIGVGKTF